MTSQKNVKDFKEGDLVEIVAKNWNGKEIRLALILRKRSEPGFNYQAYDVLDVMTGDRHYIHMFNHAARLVPESDLEQFFYDEYDDYIEYDDYDWYDWMDDDWDTWRENLELEDYR